MAWLPKVRCGGYPFHLTIFCDMTSSRIGHLPGFIGSVIVVLFWVVLVGPESWQAHFPNEGPIRILLFLAFLATIFACVKASRGWLISLIVSFVTNLLLFFASGV